MCGMVGVMDTTRSPSQEVAELAEQRVELEAALKDVRAKLAEIIRADAAAGVRQVDLVRDSRYTREQIRRICDTSVTK